MDAPPLPTPRPRKRLLFDRRYGWVFDEWKDPAEEALAGGRGTFCVLPITKSALGLASQLMTGITKGVAQALENPSMFMSGFTCKFNQPIQPAAPEVDAPSLETLPQVVSLPQGVYRPSSMTLKL